MMGSLKNSYIADYVANKIYQLYPDMDEAVSLKVGETFEDFYKRVHSKPYYLHRKLLHQFIMAKFELGELKSLDSVNNIAKVNKLDMEFKKAYEQN